jgi:hypothetical protein
MFHELRQMQISYNVEQHRQCGYERSNEVRWRKYCCRAKVLSITCSECGSVAFGMQHAKRMRRILFSNVVCPALPYFSTLSHKRHDYQKKIVIGHQMFALVSSTTFVRKISHSKTN